MVPLRIATTASFLGAMISTPKCPDEIFILLVNSPTKGGKSNNSGRTSLVSAPPGITSISYFSLLSTFSLIVFSENESSLVVFIFCDLKTLLEVSLSTGVSPLSIFWMLVIIW